MAANPLSMTLNPENHLLLDQPLLKVPHELARRTHKTAQRLIERERETLLSSLKTAAVSASQAASSSGSGSTVTSLDAMISRMETLKRKLDALHTEEKILHKQSRARIAHVQELHDVPTPSDVKYDEWSKVRLNRLLVDYLLRCGYGESARALARDNQVEDLVDIDAFMQCRRIEASLEQGHTGPCLSWCADNKQSLKKINSDLEHEVRLQEYIELVRTRNHASLLKATKHAQKYLLSHSDPNFPIRAAALLAYAPDTPVDPYRTLFSAERWHYLSTLFLRTHHQLLSLPQNPPLYIALSAGLSALKTPSCHSTHLSPSGATSTTAAPATATENSKPNPSAIGHSVCPICSTELNELARNVPYAHHAKSVVENDPVVLPNGRVYGREKLMAFQHKLGVGGSNDAWIRDPADPERYFEVHKIKKVYIS